jgi:hypothetical protein
MNSCLHCKYAEWKRTVNGRINPHQVGRCTYEIKVTLPSAFFWDGFGENRKPPVRGGWIDRKAPKEKCPTFQRESV